MAGYKRIYIFGGQGGFQGVDGVNPLIMQIWVGVSDGKWFEAHYFSDDLKPISNIKILYPSAGNEREDLLEACIIFAPKFFNKMKSIDLVQSHFKNHSEKSLNLRKNKPVFWNDVLSEAMPIFEELNLFKSDIIGIDRKEVINDNY